MTKGRVSGLLFRIQTLPARTAELKPLPGVAARIKDEAWRERDRENQRRYRERKKAAQNDP